MEKVAKGYVIEDIKVKIQFKNRTDDSKIRKMLREFVRNIILTILI